MKLSDLNKYYPNGVLISSGYVTDLSRSYKLFECGCPQNSKWFWNICREIFEVELFPENIKKYDIRFSAYDSGELYKIMPQDEDWDGIEYADLDNLSKTPIDRDANRLIKYFEYKKQPILREMAILHANNIFEAKRPKPRAKEKKLVCINCQWESEMTEWESSLPIGSNLKKFCYMCHKRSMLVIDDENNIPIKREDLMGCSDKARSNFEGKFIDDVCKE